MLNFTVRISIYDNSEGIYFGFEGRNLVEITVCEDYTLHGHLKERLNVEDETREFNLIPFSDSKTSTYREELFRKGSIRSQPRPKTEVDI